MKLKTNTSNTFQFIRLYVPKICPLLVFYFVKDVWGKHICSLLRVKQPKNNVVEVTGRLLKKYLRYLRRLYWMQVNLTVSKTKICVHEISYTSYVNKISILHFHNLGRFTSFATVKEN